MDTTRTDRPYCLSCGYGLDGLDAGPCPECGRLFRWNDPDSYGRGERKNFFRMWAPGVLLSITVGVILIVTLGGGMGAVGAGVWFGVPTCMGVLLGYRVKAKWTALFLLACVVSAGTGFALVTMNLAGAYCGIALVLVMAIPLLIGVAMGTVLRVLLQVGGYAQARFLPVVIALLIPTTWSLIDRAGGRTHTEIAVTTERVVIGEPEDVWRELMFFEDVRTRPPLLMRIALPRPLWTEGSMANVGDRRVCVYTAGRLTKEITAVTPAQELAFRVVEQEFEPAAVLTGGSFRVEPAGPGRTRLTLETRYVPVHSPRVLWRIAEFVGVRTLHTHVINGVELAVTESLERE